MPRLDIEAPLELWVTTAEGSPVMPRVILIDPDGVEVHVAEEVHPSTRLSWWEGAPGDWTVKVEDANGGGGADYWLVLHVRVWTRGLGEDGTWEVEPNPPEQPQVIPDTSTPGTIHVNRPIYGRLEAEGDLDRFVIERADLGQAVCLECSGWGSGSSTPIRYQLGSVDHTEDPLSPRPRTHLLIVTELPLTLTVSSADHYGPNTFYECSVSYPPDGYGCHSWYDE